MTLDKLKERKEWRYLSKDEKINLYLKDLFINYPSKPIPIKEFESFCMYDLGININKIRNHIEVFLNMGVIDIKDEKIVSVSAESKLKYQEELKKVQNKEEQKKIEDVFKNLK